MTHDRWINSALHAHAERAIQTLEAVMRRPAIDDLSQRLLVHIAELLAQQHELYADLRRKDSQIAYLRQELARHTNGPAANGAVVNPERKERSYEGGYHDV